MSEQLLPSASAEETMPFGPAYADVYDALYEDKDYAKEAQFVLEQIHKLAPKPELRVLDLGCGTGRHAVALAERGIRVIGIDRSPFMVAAAERRREQPTSNFARSSGVSSRRHPRSRSRPEV